GFWAAADKVFDLYGRESHSASIIRRAILKYALSCPPAANPKVIEFLAERRKDSAKILEEVQELLNLESPKPTAAAAAAAPAAAATDLRIDRVIKFDPTIAGRKMLTLPRYIPVDPKDPPRFLVFCDITGGKVDPFRGCPATLAIVEYVSGTLALNANDSAKL